MKSETTILNKDFHARLLQDIETVATVARVPVSFLHRSMTYYCPKPIVDWVKSYPDYMRDDSGGLCLTGKITDVDTQMRAIAAAFLRNYVDARVINIHALVKPEEDPENPTVLLIPDFYIKSVTGSIAFTNWQLRELYGLLLDRFINRRATILYVQDFTKLKAEYGDAVYELIKAHWQIL